MEIKVTQNEDKLKSQIKKCIMNELENNVKIEFDKESFADRMAQHLKDDDEFRHNIAWLCA